MVGATGKVTFLDGPPGTPLGAGGTDFRTEEVPLPPGSLLALYTDGLIEARYRDLDQGLEQLARALGQPQLGHWSSCATRSWSGSCRMAPQDDVAVLLARTVVP